MRLVSDVTRRHSEVRRFRGHGGNTSRQGGERRRMETDSTHDGVMHPPAALTLVNLAR